MTDRIRIIPFLYVSAIASAMLLAPVGRAQTEITAENLRDEHVQAAMQAIIEELYRRKDLERFWEPPAGRRVESQAGGYTALAALALTYAGATYQDERLADAIEYLESLELGGTYAVSVRANLWALLPPRYRPQLDKDRRWLLEGFSERAGGWNYEQEPFTTRRDNSITQYGALALWEAAKRGLRVEARFWKMLEDRFIQMQVADGGWNYTGTGPSTGSMTTAGLTVLFITQDFLHAHEAVQIDRRESRHQSAIEKGLEWMEENFTAETNPGRETDYYYYMYGVERVGLASGYKYFGGHDWYREGAAALIGRLCTWHDESKAMTVNETIFNRPNAGEISTVDLSFSLMFLSRGRVPVSINKLSDASFEWNNRPRDVANLARFIEDRSETGLNWQIVSIDAAPEEWLDAPVLYLASNQALPWVPNDDAEADRAVERQLVHLGQLARGEATGGETPLSPWPQLEKLKRYLDLGGLLFANAESVSRPFIQSVERAGRIMYPNYEWRDLQRDHPAYTLYQPIEDPAISLRALSNGVRELIILSTKTDFSENFQAANIARAAQPFEAGMNIYLYASELNRSKPRVEAHVLEREALRMGAATPVTIVHASHGANWNAEPLALHVFAAWAWNERGFDVEIVTSPLEGIDQVEPPPALVVVSGTGAIDLANEEQEAIKRYVEGGGVILFESTGGGGDLTLGAEREMRTLFDQPVRSLLRHRVISGEGIPGAVALTRLEYRPYCLNVFGGRETSPRIRGMTFGSSGGEARVLFSREDLLNGLLDQPVWGVAGYAPRWSREVLANILQYGARLREIR